MRLIDSKSVFT